FWQVFLANIDLHFFPTRRSSDLLVDNGFSVEQAASLLTAYGITVALASWASGVFVEMFGPKKTMTVGLIIYILGSASFIYFGMRSEEHTSELQSRFDLVCRLLRE